MTEARKLGNDAFNAGNFSDAVKHYTEALEADVTNEKLYSNRAAAYAKVGNYELSLADANRAITLKKDWAKPYSRKGHALYHLRRFPEAMNAYTNGLAIEPQNTEMLEALKACEKADNQMHEWMAGESAKQVEKMQKNMDEFREKYKVVIDPISRLLSPAWTHVYEPAWQRFILPAIVAAFETATARVSELYAKHAASHVVPLREKASERLVAMWNAYDEWYRTKFFPWYHRLKNRVEPFLREKALPFLSDAATKVGNAVKPLYDRASEKVSELMSRGAAASAQGPSTSGST